MGKIKGDGESVTVELEVDELTRQRVYLKVPDSRPPLGVAVRWVGNRISRAVWAIIV